MIPDNNFDREDHGTILGPPLPDSKLHSFAIGAQQPDQMRLLRLQQPLRAAAGSSFRPTISFAWSHRPEILSPSRIDVGNQAVEGRRNATVKSQGAYKLTSKKTIPKKLGAKRTGDQYVIPGNIIYKQRGTLWHAGENTILGRDHTIHAAVSGYVKYYRDPARHPTRQYIGVVFNREDKLPYPPNAMRKRKLGLVAVPRKPEVKSEALSLSGIPRRVIRKEGVMQIQDAIQAAQEADAAIEAAESQQPAAADGKKKKHTKYRAPAAYLARRWSERMRIKRSNRVLLLQKDYSYREANSAIGRLMGRHRGKTPGTVVLGSRHGKLRARRRKRDAEFAQRQEALRQRRVMAAAREKERQEMLAKRAAKAKAKKDGKKDKKAAA
ncbi:uncharacterized protein E0L32_009868 [Thyridium curvatum]|uniref:Large ribosomal subunit protein bL27m n=1 Tax=Thyridium curvatum TaxID=1093900 RepID=A0A507AUS4_9PEZI|nr:uncharacterized protein E0L32_009868 [Thyridium curvatum]TPX08679.1 hypothetical protein E0L32_009868 [Thyridium curvatum]